MQVEAGVEEKFVDLPKEEIDDISKAVEESMSESDDSKDDDNEADDKEESSDESDDSGESDRDEPEEEEEDNSEDDDEVSDEDNEHDGDDDEVSDDMLEKAISLGVPIAEARKLGSELLQGRIASLEEQQGSQDGKSADDESPSNDPLEGIPDLDPDIYDEELVEGFKAMKQIIRDQSATIESMSKASTENGVLSRLDEDASAALKANPEKESELLEKVSILTEGYKAVGKDVSSADVIAEAVSSVLGDDIEKVAASKKTVKAKKRSGQKISRSTGGRNSESKDVFDEIGDELNRKFFDKK